ncbi:MAG: hypothetical protein PHT07_10580 [Paludibacter sp.]|nr:hypothetical protein [Paludibacter sp.]
MINRRISIVLTLVLSSQINASLLDSAISGGITGGIEQLVKNGFSLPPVLGKTDVSLQCNPNVTSFNLPTPDLCKTINSLDTLAQKSIAFKIGPCDIGGGNPLSCTSSSIKKYCQDRAKKPISDVVGGIRRGENNVIDAGRKKVIITGGEQYAKQTGCGVLPTVEERFPEAAKAYKSVTQLSNSPAYGSITNTRLFKDSSECYEAMLKAGQNTASAARYCSPQSIGSSGSGQTHSDVEIESFKTARETMASPLRNAASGSFMDEVQLRNWISSKCANKTTEAEAQSCATSVINDQYKMKEKLQTVVSEIESKEAARSYLFESATTHQKTITHPTEDYRKTLPVEMRNAYTGTAAKAMAQDTLIGVFNRRISESKKELANLMMQKTELAAKPYYSSIEAKKINEALSNAGAQ